MRSLRLLRKPPKCATHEANTLLPVPTGNFVCDGNEIMGISTQAPICAEPRVDDVWHGPSDLPKPSLTSTAGHCRTALELAVDAPS